MKAHRNTTLALLGLTGLVLIVGCQWPGRRGGLAARPAVGTPSAMTGSASLSNQQVADMHLALGRTLEQQKDYERALDAYTKAAELDPKLAAAVWRQGVVCDKQGRSRESEGYYRQALKITPRDHELLCDYGYSLYLQRRWAEAEETFRKALEESPRHPRSHCNLGLVLAQTDRASEALVQFQQAGCDISAAHSNLGLVLAMNNRLTEAKAAYAQALASKPKAIEARRGMELIARVEQRSGRSGHLQLVGHESNSSGVRPTSGETKPTVTPGEPLIVPAAGVSEPDSFNEHSIEESEPAHLDQAGAIRSSATSASAAPGCPLEETGSLEAGVGEKVARPVPRESVEPARVPSVTPRGPRPRVKRIVQ